MDSARVARIEHGRLDGLRPRRAGSNARLGEHGSRIRLPLVRITTDNGARGFGACWANRDEAAALVGRRIDELIGVERGVSETGRRFEYPLWDLLGQLTGRPVYTLAEAITDASARTDALAIASKPRRAPCYDTSLYFDDLSLNSIGEAAALIASEACEGFERGHRAFKIKVGRGARHLPQEEGVQRDIAIVRAVREAVGPASVLMLDANNGYNLNLTRRVLSETADCGVFWMEEPFHEDPVLYTDLKEWMAAAGMAVLIADGEGEASRWLIDWARAGLIDVIQYDISGHGFTRWLETGRELDAYGVRSAPHHYGGLFGNYAACHLSGAIQHFAFVEWDEAAAPGLDGSAYQIVEGKVILPDEPGFGLRLDENRFRNAVADGGYDVR